MIQQMTRAGCARVKLTPTLRPSQRALMQLTWKRMRRRCWLRRAPAWLTHGAQQGLG